MKGAVEGTLTMNEVQFQLDGKQYSLFTGNPIVFGRIRVWVKHYASIKECRSDFPRGELVGGKPGACVRRFRESRSQ
jgi:hypothetical protein